MADDNGDAQALQKIATILRTPEVIERRLLEADFGVEPGSDLDGDDSQLAGYYQPSSSALRAIATSVSHWKAICEALVVDGHGWIHSYYPLIRAAIENAAMAHWMLVPDDRQMRIHRQLLIGWTDLDEDMKAFGVGGGRESAVETAAALKERNDKKANVVKLARLNGKALSNPRKDDPSKDYDPKYNYIDLVQSIPRHPQMSPPETIWRACSGMAHGKWWAFYMLSGRNNEKPMGTTTQSADFSLDLNALTACIGVGVYSVEQAVAMFDRRRTKPATTTSTSE